MQGYTTPTNVFYLSIDPGDWDEFRITYVQNKQVILEKTENDDCVCYQILGKNRYKLMVKLTQEETSLFDPKYVLKIEIKCHYPDGTTFASNTIQIRVSDILNHDILGSE